VSTLLSLRFPLRLAWLCLLLLGLAAPGTAQNSGGDRVTVRLSADKIALDETATLTISISGLADGLDIPAPETRDGGLQFSYTGRRISMNSINGSMSSSVEIDYMVMPMRTGTHLIEPISGSVAGIPFTTLSQRLEVTDVGTGSPPPRQQGYNPYSGIYPGGLPGGIPGGIPGGLPGGIDPADHDLWGWPPRRREPEVLLEATVEPATVYKHQPVYYNLSLLTTGRLLSDPRYNPIVPVGFLRLAFPQENSQQERDGSLYSVMSVKTAYFPLNEGEYTFEPSQVSVSSGFLNPRILKTEARKVKVLPLPSQGRPRSFTGAVGEQFEVRANLKTPEIETGGTAELEITVKGDGHLELVPYPFLPEWDGLEKKQLSSPSTTEVVNGQIVSRRTYNFRLKPTRQGSYTLNGITLAYFNPRQERYETVKAPDLTLHVVPGQGPQPDDQSSPDADLAASDRPWTNPGPSEGQLPELPLGALLVGGVLLAAGALLLGASPGRLALPSRQARGKAVSARHRSLPALVEALAQLAPGSDSESRRVHLQQQGWNDQQIARLESLKRQASRALFGGGASSSDKSGQSELLDQLNRELGELLRERKKK
jgi:hypothetical protein